MRECEGVRDSERAHVCVRACIQWAWSPALGVTHARKGLHVSQDAQTLAGGGACQL